MKRIFQTHPKRGIRILIHVAKTNIIFEPEPGTVSPSGPLSIPKVLRYCFVMCAEYTPGQPMEVEKLMVAIENFKNILRGNYQDLRIFPRDQAPIIRKTADDKKVP
jgi:hypothetical protein